MEIASDQEFNGWPNLNIQTPAIILIENDDITLELYQRELSKSFKVFAFTELRGVLEVMTNQDIRAVVIEPEIDSRKGWDLIRSIHETFSNRPIPVIVCTTCDSNGAVSPLDITQYMTKPVLPKTLREKTLQVISEKKHLKKTI